MEDSKNRANNKQKRRKIQVTTGHVPGGGGIGGILLLGGAFVAAAFAITLANKANKKNPKFPTLKKSKPPNCNNSKEEERYEGLRSLLQFPSPSADSHRCCSSSSIGFVATRIGSTKIDSSESVAIEPQITEEKLKSVTCGDQELVSDNSKAESSNNNVVMERFSSSDMEMCLLNQENINEDDHVEDSPFLEVIPVSGEKVELSEIANMEKNIHEEEEEDIDDEVEDEEDIIDDDEEEEEEEEEEESDEVDEESIDEGKEEEDSEGTGNSSRESNAEAIWPVELIEEKQLELKEMKNQQNVGILQEKMYKTMEDEEVVWDQEEKMEMVHQNAPLIIITSKKSRFPSWSTLAVGLLLLMILHQLLVTYYLNLDSPLLFLFSS